LISIKAAGAAARLPLGKNQRRNVASGYCFNGGSSLAAQAIAAPDGGPLAGALSRRRHPISRAPTVGQSTAGHQLHGVEDRFIGGDANYVPRHNVFDLHCHEHPHLESSGPIHSCDLAQSNYAKKCAAIWQSRLPQNIPDIGVRDTASFLLKHAKKDARLPSMADQLSRLPPSV
jgi:hypothetical protein